LSSGLGYSMRRSQRGGLYAQGRCTEQEKNVAGTGAACAEFFSPMAKPARTNYIAGPRTRRPIASARVDGQPNLFAPLTGSWHCKGLNPTCWQGPSSARGRQQEVFPQRFLWHSGCILDGHAGCDARARNEFCAAASSRGRSTCRRPPVWRAVVRPARSFLPPSAGLSRGSRRPPPYTDCGAKTRR
jgi:hypothetical protein